MPLDTNALNDALAEVLADIKAGRFTATTVPEIAEGYGLRPEVLERKFTEKHGKPAAEFVVVDMTEAMWVRAEEAALEWSRSFTGPKTVLGKRFKYRDLKPMVAVAWTSDGLHTIRAETCERRVISWPNQASAYAWIEKNLL